MDFAEHVVAVGQVQTDDEMLVELQDVERFKRAEELASFIGLTPSEFSTGQYVRQGRITRCGNKRVRTCLVESSWILIQKDPAMRLKYNRLKINKGAKRAIIAIARNLLIRIRRSFWGGNPMWWEFADGNGDVFIPKRIGLTAHFHLVTERELRFVGCGDPLS